MIFALAIFTAAAGEHAGTQWTPTAAVTGEPGDVVYEHDATAVTGDNQLQGVAYYDDKFILTGGNNASDPNKVYIVDESGVLIDSFDQHATSGIGWLDLAGDSDLFYASQGAEIDKFNIDGDFEGSFAGPLSTNRALAFDQDSGNLWVADLGSDIYEFSESKGIVNQYANDKQITGLAWEKQSEGTPLLWVLAQSPTKLYQFDPSAGEYTGVSYSTDWITGTPGGIEFSEIITGPDQTLMGLLVGIDQDDPDSLFGMELFSCENGCYIEGTCYQDGETNPNETCQFCDIQQTMTAWSALGNDIDCDDGLWCTVDDVCDAGVCTGAERDCDDGEFCSGAESCDEASQQCVSSGDPCDDGQTCDEQGDACIDDDHDDDDDDDDSGCCG